MKRLRLICFVITLVSALSFAQSDSVVVDVFSDNMIQFGNSSPQNQVTVEDNGRIISRNVEIPAFNYPVSVTAYLKYYSVNDPWDRAGSVYLAANNNQNIELLKFITGFGTGSSTSTQFVKYAEYTEDVTSLVSLLAGKVTIKTMIDTWVSSAWRVSVKLIFKKKESGVNPVWAKGIYNEQWLNEPKVTLTKPVVTVDIPVDVKQISVAYFASGHCSDGTGSDEFVQKENVIYLDGKEILNYVPWRDDCKNFRPYNPKSGKWGDTWSSDLPRSGWCPGDIVHPVKFDITNITPGEHKIRFQVKEIRPPDTKGEGYWRVSSYISGFKADVSSSPSKIEIAGPASTDFLSNLIPYPVRIDLVDNSGYIVATKAADVQVKSKNPDVLFSYDNDTWQNPLTLNVKNGSTQIWFKGNEGGAAEIQVVDLSSSIAASNVLNYVINKNIAREASAKAIGKCADNEAAQYAIDGRTDTKWCFKNLTMLPYDLTLGFKDPKTFNHIVIKHAGAGNENPNWNTVSYRVEAKTSAGKWEKVAENLDNPRDERGNITEDHLANKVTADSVRLLILNPGGDDATRIYEFELYNTTLTSVHENSMTIPAGFLLYPNYPNPFNGSTTVKFFAPDFSSASVAVYNTLGELVCSLFSGELPKGTYSFNWDARNNSGKRIAGGVYFVNVKLNSAGRIYNSSQKMIYLP